MACSRGAFRRISVEGIKDGWKIPLFLRQTGQRKQTFVPCDGQKARELFNIFAKRFSFARGLNDAPFLSPIFLVYSPLSWPSSETLTIETAAFTGGITRPGLVTKTRTDNYPGIKNSKISPL